jgi:hypothetical protein
MNRKETQRYVTQKESPEDRERRINGNVLAKILGRPDLVEKEPHIKRTEVPIKYKKCPMCKNIAMKEVGKQGGKRGALKTVERCEYCGYIRIK